MLTISLQEHENEMYTIMPFTLNQTFTNVRRDYLMDQIKWVNTIYFLPLIPQSQNWKKNEEEEKQGREANLQKLQL